MSTGRKHLFHVKNKREGEKNFPLVYDLKLPGCSRLKSTDVLSKNNLTSGSLCVLRVP